MICHNCHKYGHTKPRCRRKRVCRSCGKKYHASDKTNKYPNKSKCANCGEGLMAGSNNGKNEIKERVIEKRQADSRVRRRRAPKILAGEDQSPWLNPQSYSTHFRCKMDPEKNVKMNPWATEKSFTQELGSQPATLRSINESAFVIEVSIEKESKILPTTKSLCSLQIQEKVEVEIFACDKINQSNGLI